MNSESHPTTNVNILAKYQRFLQIKLKKKICKGDIRTSKRDLFSKIKQNHTSSHFGLPIRMLGGSMSVTRNTPFRSDSIFGNFEIKYK